MPALPAHITRTRPSPHFFALWRIALGAAFALGGCVLLVTAREDIGVIPAAALLIGGLSVTCGWRRAALLALIPALIFLFHGGPLNSAGLVLALTVILLAAMPPAGEPWAFTKRRTQEQDTLWRMPWQIWLAARLFALLALTLAMVAASMKENLLPGVLWLILLHIALIAWLMPWAPARALVMISAVALPAMCFAASLLPAFGAAMLFFLLLYALNPLFPPPAVARERIVFFDNSCGLCTRAVRFCLAEDALDHLKFAPLDGETAHALAANQPLLDPKNPQRPDSLIVWVAYDGRHPDTTLCRSAATREIARALGGWWQLLNLATLPIPYIWADRIYDTIAANRHTICRLDKAKETSPQSLHPHRFLP